MRRGNLYIGSLGIHLSLFLIIANLQGLSQPRLSQDTVSIASLLDTATNPSMKGTGASNSSFVIGNIIIEGNKKTKPFIITRELPFREGDSVNLAQLVDGFEVARSQLMNTTLFVDVIVALKSFRGYEVDILIDVKERWYIFPVPYVKPVDRNLAEWVKQGFGVDRLNYGFKFTYNNFTGRNDKLRIWLITGYTKQIQFLYEQPYADKSLKHGYKVGFSYGFNKEVNYATINNEQQFVDTLDGGVNRWYAHVDYTYRPGLRTFNAFRFAMVQQDVDTQVIVMNPHYYGEQKKTRVTYPEFSYILSYFKVDYIPYPTKGWMAEVAFLKRGLAKNMNLWQLTTKFTRSWPVMKKTYFSTQDYGVIKLPFKQPFLNQRLFGYSDVYLRGLENYVIDGVAAFLTRNTFRREIIRFDVPTFLNSRSHSKIPFRFYAKLFGDMGYSHNPNPGDNSLTDRMLYTWGGGIDVVSFYDFVFRFEYSFNQLGQNGLFLHIKNDF